MNRFSPICRPLLTFMRPQRQIIQLLHIHLAFLFAQLIIRPDRPTGQYRKKNLLCNIIIVTVREDRHPQHHQHFTQRREHDHRVAILIRAQGQHTEAGIRAMKGQCESGDRMRSGR